MLKGSPQCAVLLSPPAHSVQFCSVPLPCSSRHDSRSPGSVSYLPSFFTKLENTCPLVKSKKQEIFRKMNSSAGGDSEVGERVLLLSPSPLPLFSPLLLSPYSLPLSSPLILSPYSLPLFSPLILSPYYLPFIQCFMIISHGECLSDIFGKCVYFLNLYSAFIQILYLCNSHKQSLPCQAPTCNWGSG